MVRLDTFYILIQGPLNIWTEHSNCQTSRRDSKTLIALMIPNILLIFLWNYFSNHIKADIWFDILHVFLENSVNSELCFFKPAKIWNLSKNAYVLWTFLDYKSSGSKKSTPIRLRVCNRSPPYYVFSKNAILGSVPSNSSEVLD